MTLSDVQAVRLKAADRPTFHREEQEQNETGNLFFRLDFNNLMSTPALTVRVDGVLQTLTTHYTADLENGTVTFVLAPALGAALIFEYTATVFTDEEIEHFLGESSDSTTLAAAKVLYAWAADAARLAKKESLSGGGGMGSVSLTTDMRAREMRASADAYMKQYETYENAGVPVEFVTEVAWTEQVADRMVENHLLDNLS